MKEFKVQVKLTKKDWFTLESFGTSGAAMEYVTQREGDKYPLRILRVVSTVVFHDKGDKS